MTASPASYISPFSAPPEGRAAGRGAWATWIGVVACALAWIALIMSAPVLAARGHESVAAMVYGGLAGICHQLPERSFWIAGHPLAVCARCFGIYAGFAVAALFYPLLRSLARTDTPPRAWLIVALLPTTIDFLLGFTSLWTNTHLSRALTGAWLGAWVAVFIVPGLIEIGQSCAGRFMSEPTLNRQRA